jgi:hypothetical protein
MANRLSIIILLACCGCKAPHVTDSIYPPVPMTTTAAPTPWLAPRSVPAQQWHDLPPFVYPADATNHDWVLEWSSGTEIFHGTPSGTYDITNAPAGQQFYRMRAITNEPSSGLFYPMKGL